MCLFLSLFVEGCVWVEPGAGRGWAWLGVAGRGRAWQGGLSRVGRCGVGVINYPLQLHTVPPCQPRPIVTVGVTHLVSLRSGTNRHIHTVTSNSWCYPPNVMAASHQQTHAHCASPLSRPTITFGVKLGILLCVRIAFAF